MSNSYAFSFLVDHYFRDALMWINFTGFSRKHIQYIYFACILFYLSVNILPAHLCDCELDSLPQLQCLVDLYPRAYFSCLESFIALMWI